MAPASSHNGQSLAYILEDEPGQRSAAKMFTRDEARRIAAKRRDEARPANIAKLPEGREQALTAR
jgi:hypothetical protein